MEYAIKYVYQTGGSNYVEDREDVLDLTFSDLNVAESNLRRINEHYDMYKQLNEHYRVDTQALLESFADKDWFVKELILVAYKGDYNGKNYFAIDSLKNAELNGYSTKYIISTHKAENSIILYSDIGTKFQFYPPWCGYFEQLYSVEIIVNDKFLKFEF